MLIFCLIWILPAPLAEARADIRNSMVKITTVYDEPSYTNPWDFYGSKTLSGSGCVIEDGLILTNAHVVSYQTYIDVQRYGDPRKYKARVKAVSHQADLALLQVDNPAFFSDVKALEMDDLPETRQEVTVYGYPEGGNTLSITRGVISRIEHQRYVHSSAELLAIQIDAAVNPGNSGGPALIDDKIVGVVMQNRPRADNIGYIVPTPVIKHFLKDIQDGRFDGIPEDGLFVQPMENDFLKACYGIKKGSSGVLVTYVLPGSPAEGIMRPGDVLLAIDGHPVADNMTVEFRKNDRTSAGYYVQKHQMGETVMMDAIRDGNPFTCNIRLEKKLSSFSLVPYPQYDVRPSYFIYGGLLFMPLTTDYLMAWGKRWRGNAPPELMAATTRLPTREGEELVLLSRVLPHDVNMGYHDYKEKIITHVNGQELLNLKHLIRILDQGRRQPYVKFTTSSRDIIVLNPAEAERAMPQILKIYNIPADRSEDLQ
jgi:S1-C subfamily serine protease